MTEFSTFVKSFRSIKTQTELADTKICAFVNVSIDYMIFHIKCCYCDELFSIWNCSSFVQHIQEKHCSSGKEFVEDHFVEVIENDTPNEIIIPNNLNETEMEHDDIVEKQVTKTNGNVDENFLEGFQICTEEVDLKSEIISADDIGDSTLNEICVTSTSSSASAASTISPSSAINPAFSRSLKSNIENTMESISQGEFKKLLSSSVVGRSILRNYKLTKTLSPKQRKIIATIIVEFLLNNDIKTSPKIFESYANEIVECFPSEVTEIYFIHEKGRRIKGCLYYKYHNTMSNLRRDGLIKSKENSKENPVLDKPIDIDEIVSDDNSEADCNWLKYNIKPYYEVVNKWTSTFYRRHADLRSYKDLNAVLNDWPLYKQSFGHNLIDLDFKAIYPGKENKLFEKWPKDLVKIKTLMTRRIKDSYSVELLSQISTEDCSSDICSTIIVVLLHSLFPPTSRKVQKSADNMVSKVLKPKIVDSRNTFIIRASTATDLKSKIKETTANYFSSEKTLPPIICVIGENFSKLIEFYVYFGEIFYKLENIIKSLDICFKIFHVFNLDYPIECKLVWIFIKSFFYEINLISSERTSSIFAAINDIKNS